MLNQIILVGRLIRDPELKKSENNKQYSFISLAIPRSYKNSDGNYDSDYIDCILWEGVAKSTTEYCKKGDIVGVKGRLQTRKIELDDEKTRQVTEVVAEKVTFLSSKKHEEEE